MQALIPRKRAQVRSLSPWLVLPPPIFCFLCPSNEQIVNLEESAQQLRHQLSDSQHTANQREDNLNETIDSLRVILRARDEYSSASIATPAHPPLNVSLLDDKITRLEHTVQELNVELAESHHKADSLIRIIRAHEQKDHCESLYAQGRIYDAAESLLEIANTVNEDMRGDAFFFDWHAGEVRRSALG